MTPRLVRGAAIAALALSLNTGVAAAKGGGGAPAPAPSAPALDCYGDPAIVAMTTPDIAVNYAGSAGCVGVSNATGSLRLAWVVLNTGWTYEVLSNGDGTSQRVQIKFTETATGKRIDFRYELGKTKVG